MVQQLDQLDPPTATEVVALAEAAAATDGVAPLAEQTLLRVRHGGGGVHMLLRDQPGRLIGYGYLDLGDPAGPTAELVVHPAARGAGAGRALATSALKLAGDHDPAGRLRIWAHGDHPGANRLAESLGFARSRVLHQLRRPLDTPLPEPELPPGVVLRAYRPGEDDQAWLALNARAFADHPEQGRWQETDLRLRLAEPWFSAAGFLLAVRADTGALLGFHWTKVHPAEGPGGAPIGEVYVLGVDPAAHGTGLGRALTLAGLRHLRDRGLPQALLYVDGSNQAAMALYRKLGFTDWAVDVMFSYPAHPA
ncbi:mycothiol synthase [Natronosporangium hydrolyticum]|uniref:Mycothiol acetyltransferase n=1 Tax=Natronosporangium hydrolyticum TaxID=2811111 RepID=A0A895YNK4_9ACTN|nr:mycothiol synthase [Natronosporangium hydrolyticum]QSB17542.1 mycothiol synthase [Natronosporangium hydrolyticum]